MESFKTFEDKLNFIKDTILKHVQAKYIYLFGSYAYGEPKEDSDIDIYAVIPDEIEEKRALLIDIKSDFFDVELFYVDLHIANESKFNLERTRRSFYETIYEKGILIYENT